MNMDTIIDRLRRRATVVYIAVDKSVADDLSATMLEAAQELEDAYAEIRKQVFGSNVVFDRAVCDRADEALKEWE